MSASSTNTPACDFHVDDCVTRRLVPAAAYLARASPITTLVVGAAILHPTEPRLLLVQRADTEHFFPGMYELPGGKADPGDATILHAVVRETAEETGLRVTRVVRETCGFEYATQKTLGGGMVTRRYSRQMNFVLEVEEWECVRLNPAEHQRSVWALEGEVDGLPMTEEMAKVVKEIFRAVRDADE